MKTYPIMLNVTGRLCVVVGAGAVGRRKAEGLARASARVRLVDPAPGGSADAPEGVERLDRAYEPALLAGAMLVFACTDDADLNARIAADARSAGAMVNVADSPEQCDFLAPAAVADGDVVVAVGTGGAAPALAATLRDTLRLHLPQRIGEFAAALRSARRHVHGRTGDPHQRRRIMRQLAGETGYKAFLDAGADGLIGLAGEVAEAL